MTEFTQILEKFGIPYGVLLAAVTVLWREVQRLRQKNEELHDRLEKRAPDPVPDKRLEQIVSSAERIETLVKRMLAKVKPARTSTDEQGRTPT